MVYILLAPGFEEAEALVPADLLRRAGIQTALTGVEDQMVAGTHDIVVRADRVIAQVDLRDAEMIVLPGGGCGVQNLREHPAVAALAQEAVDRGIPLAAICAAPTLLGEWGMLKGRRATCYPGMEEKLTGGQAEDASVVADRNLITGRAAGSAFEFGLALIRALAGAEKAEEVRHAVHYY